MTDQPMYAHDAHCNTIHEAGPEPCPPARQPGDTERLRLANDATLQRLAQRGVDASHVIHTARIVALLDLLFDEPQRQVYEHTVQEKIAEALASIEEQLAAHEARSKLLAGVNVAAPNGQR